MAYAGDRRGLTTLDITDPEREDYKRRIREAQGAGSGPVTETIDLSVFEPLRPHGHGRRRPEMTLKINRTMVSIAASAYRLLGEPPRIRVLVAPRALALVAAAEDDGDAYVPRRKILQDGRVYGGAVLGTASLVRALVERGWPMGELIPLRHYPEQRALVAVLPRGREGAA